MAAWHLLVRDESALPAVAAACERVPLGVPVLAVLEVADAAEQLPLPGPGALRVTWLPRTAADPAQLLGSVRALEFPPGRVHAFVPGESGPVRDVRRHPGRRAAGAAGAAVGVGLLAPGARRGRPADRRRPHRPRRPADQAGGSMTVDGGPSTRPGPSVVLSAT